LKASPLTEGGAAKAHPGVEVCSVESRRAVKSRKFKTCLSTDNYTASEAGILTEGSTSEAGPVAEGCTRETGKVIKCGAFELGQVAEGCTGEARAAWFEDVSSPGTEQIDATPFAL
jgi:hypothetical protein